MMAIKLVVMVCLKKTEKTYGLSPWSMGRLESDLEI